MDKPLQQKIDKDLSSAKTSFEVLKSADLQRVSGAGADCTNGTYSVCHIDGTTDGDGDNIMIGGGY